MVVLLVGLVALPRRRLRRLLRHRLLEVEVPLEQPAPRGHVDVHLLGAGDLALLPEDLALPTELGLAADHRVQELDLEAKRNF